mgnify:CR=1 FL=1
MPLSPKLAVFSRFQIRVLFQNMSNYVVLFIGIIFANMLLMFGLIFPSILNHYQESIPKQMICNYQYMLQVPIEAMDEEHKLESMIQMLLFSKAVETDNEDAEKFSAYSLEQSMSTGKKDGVTITVWQKIAVIFRLIFLIMYRMYTYHRLMRKNTIW